jgi:hypothetical protein
MLTHICPNCKTPHECNSTPEPDRLCPPCELAELDRAKPEGQPDDREEVRFCYECKDEIRSDELAEVKVVEFDENDVHGHHPVFVHGVCKPKPIISINPPPSDYCCMGCGKHISEVKPFGKAGDPLVGDFDGVTLLKNFRSMAVPNDWKKNLDKVWKSIEVKYTDFVLANKNFYKAKGEDALIYLGLRRFLDDLNKYYDEEKAWQIFGETCGRAVYDKFRDLDFDYSIVLNRTKKYAKVDEEFCLRLSPDDYQQYGFADQVCNTVESSWECRDCFILSDEDFYAMRDKKC